MISAYKKKILFVVLVLVLLMVSIYTGIMYLDASVSVRPDMLPIVFDKDRELFYNIDYKTNNIEVIDAEGKILRERFTLPVDIMFGYVINDTDYLFLVANGNSLYRISKDNLQLEILVKQRQPIFYTKYFIDSNSIIFYKMADTAVLSNNKVTIFNKGDGSITTKRLENSSYMSGIMLYNGYLIYSFTGQNLFIKQADNFNEIISLNISTKGQERNPAIGYKNLIYKKIGESIYQFNPNLRNFHTISYDGVSNLCCSDENFLYSISKLDNGFSIKANLVKDNNLEAFWNKEISFYGEIIQNDRLIYIYKLSTKNGRILCIEKQTGNILWEIQLSNGSYINTVESSMEYSFLETFNGYIYIIDNYTGTILKTYKTESVYYWKAYNNTLFIYDNNRFIEIDLNTNVESEF